jgi:UDP-N-acetylmuramyl pentapeptide synthase
VVFGSEVPVDVVHAAANEAVVLWASEDGWTAFGVIAREWRRRCRFQVVGITGSSGKTSTKDILAGLLRFGRLEVVASSANLNNELGVPLTLLGAVPDTDVVICEMGMRAPGEIAYLCSIAEPDFTILTNAGSAHLELLGSLEAIAAAKAEIIAGTKPDGAAVVPSAQAELVAMAERAPERVVTVGREPGANIRMGDVLRSGSHSRVSLPDLCAAGSVVLPPRGAHHALNLAMAAAVASEIEWRVIGWIDAGGEPSRRLRNFAGIGVENLLDALPELEISAGRGERDLLRDGTLVIDDAYNANPESMWAAIRDLADMQCERRVAVLGFMAELGPTSASLHRALGADAAGTGSVDQLIVVGLQPEAREIVTGWRMASGGPVTEYDSVEEALAARDEWLRPGDAVLVKASNSVGLGRIARALVEQGGASSTVPTTAQGDAE